MDELNYENAREMLGIDPEDLETDMVEAPEILAFFVEQYAIAEEEYLHARFNFEREEGRLTAVHREKLVKKAKKLYTQERNAEDQAVAAAKAAGTPYKRADVKLVMPISSDVMAEVMGDPDYEAARSRYILAEVKKTKMKGWCDVARVKRDMLTAIGLKKNSELRARPIQVANSNLTTSGKIPPAISSDDPTETPF